MTTFIKENFNNNHHSKIFNDKAIILCKKMYVKMPKMDIWTFWSELKSC